MRIKPGLLTLSCFGLAAGALSLMPIARAQGSTALLAAPSIRIAEPVSNQALVTLKGNTDPRAKAQFDQGAAASSLQTGRLQLLLRPSAAQQSALQQYLGSLQDPHSPNYHKWLTPQSFGASFGISDQDLQTVESWLQGEGFTVDSVPASRNFIQFSGTFGQIAQAFHTSMHSYMINGVQHYSNASDPSIPAALSPVVLGVSPLNDFHPRPNHVQQMRGQAQNTNGHINMVGSAVQGARPAYTSPVVANGTNYLLVTPADAATIYDSPNSLNGKFSGSTQQTGAGVSIGLVGDSDLPLADYENYRRLLLNEATPTPPNQVIDGVDPGQVNDGSSEEALIDAEFSAGLAPGATIYFYSSADDLLQSGPLDALVRAIEDNNVSILSMSFSECESDLGPSGNAEISAIYQQAAAQGITVLVSSGDTGSASCDDDVSTAETAAMGGLSVSGLASTPYNVAVGGTDFDGLSSAFSQYVDPTVGGSSPYYRSALGYIPENPWNESISNNPPGSYTTNTAQQYTDSSGGTPFTILAAGGGGPSSAAVCNGGEDQNGNCLGTTTGYPTPSFQTGITTVPGQNPSSAPTGVRYLPDVSLFASSGSEHPATWLVCADGAVTGAGSTYTDCQPNAQGQFSFDGVGGTSTSSPAFAGILAMVAQSLGGKRLGLANNVLYNLYATNSNSGSIFHDITAGNNSQPCVSGSPNCGTNGFLTGWNAGTGYDLATGLGSVDISQLVSAWDQVQFTATTVALMANGATTPVNITHGANVTLATQVSPSAATGTVSVTGPTSQNGLAVNESIPLTNGAGTVQVNDLPGGSYSITAYYQGDVKDSPSVSSNPIQFTVAPESSSPFLGLYVADPANPSSGVQLNPSTITYGLNGNAYVQPANANASLASGSLTGSHGVATGTAVLLNNGTPYQTSQFSSTQPLNSQGVASFPLYYLSPGTYSFGAQYSGDDSYNASNTTSAIPLTVSKGPTTLTIHTGTASAASPGSLNVELDTDSTGLYPGGAVTLSVNGTAYTGGTPTQEVLSSGAIAEIVNFSVPASAVGTGVVKLQASYPGDVNYAGSSAGSCNYTAPAATAASLTGPAQGPHRGSMVLEAGTAFCSLFLLLIPGRRRAWRSLLVFCLAAGLFGVMGCGTSSNGTPTPTFPVNTTCSK